MADQQLQELCCQFWLCPDCGLPDRTEPNQVAHYGAACIDPGHRSAEPVEVVPRSEAEALAEALEAVYAVYEWTGRRHPGAHLNARQALAAYRSRHPKENAMSDGWAFTGTTADGISVRVEGHPYDPRVWLDDVEVAVTGRPQLLRDGGTRHIPTERGTLTLPHKIGHPDRTPRLRA